jgi:hypothetical protein
LLTVFSQLLLKLCSAKNPENRCLWMRTSYLRDSIITVSAAIEDFRPYVELEQRASFQTAWEAYRKEAVQDQFERVGSEWARQAETGKQVAECAITEESIHAVLKFARI